MLTIQKAKGRDRKRMHVFVFKIPRIKPICILMKKKKENRVNRISLDDFIKLKIFYIIYTTFYSTDFFFPLFYFIKANAFD